MLLFFITILVCSFLLSSVVHLFTSQQSNAAKTTTLPELNVKNLSGKNIALHKISSPAILLFYLPQSFTCQKQLEILAELNKKQTSQFKIIAIAIGDVKKEKLLKLKKESNIEFQFLIDTTAELTKKFKVSAIPTLIFYHPQQQIKFKEGLAKQDELRKIIKQELKVK